MALNYVSITKRSEKYKEVRGKVVKILPDRRFCGIRSVG
jgi:hypothetical protein